MYERCHTVLGVPPSTMRMMPVSASVTPRAANDGDTITFTFSGLPLDLEGKPLQVAIEGTDAVVERMWIGSLGGAVIASDGTAAATYTPSLSHETVVWVAKLEVADPPRMWDNPAFFLGTRCVVNPQGVDADDADVDRIGQALAAKREAKFDRPLGDLSAPDAVEHRVLCMVERLRMTTDLRIPGGEVLASSAANGGTTEVELVNALLQRLGWASRIDPGWWEQQSRSGRPWTLIRFPSVWARSIQDAAQIAAEHRDRLLHILALNRAASANPIATVVESIASGEGAGFYEVPGYAGNLAGGFLSGEDPHWLLVQDAALQHDPLLALATRLYRDATAEPTPDGRHFRLWGLLEVLSLNRLGTGQCVTRTDGTPWPGQRNTSDYAAPRVYAYLAGHMSGINEGSVVAPAADLEEAVRGWYARRNATAHYGLFDPNDALQQAQPWFPRALAIHNDALANHGVDSWLFNLREAAALALHAEIRHVGTPLV